MIFSKRTITLQEDKTLFIVPFGDIQSETEYERLDGLVSWLVQKKSEGNQVVLFGMGDYFESPSPSDRGALNAAKSGYGMYEDLAKAIMDTYEARTIKLYEQLKPLVGDFLGLLQGHHWLEFDSKLKSGMPADTNILLANLLKAEYWGTTVQLELQIDGLTFKIFASHGYGSARTPGARVIKRIRMREVVGNANWYCMGHDNEKSVYVTEVLFGREYFKQYYSGTGSFQKAYNFDNPEGSYAEKLLLPPTSLGVVIGMVKVQKDTDGKNRLDYHIST